MRIVGGALGALALSVGLALAGLGRPASAELLDDILSYRTLGELVLSPDGSQLVFVVTTSELESNRTNAELWLLGTASPVSKPRRLTTHSGRDFKPRWSRDGERVAFLSDRGGNDGIWTIAAHGGEAVLGVPFEGTIEDFAWLPESKGRDSGFLFIGTEPPVPGPRGATVVGLKPRNARLYRFRFGEEEATALTAADVHVGSFDVALSEGGPRVAFHTQPSPEVPDERLHSDLKQLSLDAGRIEDLVTQPGLDRSPLFSPDGRTVAFLSMGGRSDWLANYRLYSVAGRDRAPFNLSEAYDERIGYHSPGGERVFQWSDDGERIYFMGQDGADHRLWKLEVAGGDVAPMGEFDAGGAVGSFAVASSGDVFLSLSDPNTPAELYRLDGKTSQLEPLTSFNESYPVAQAGRTELVSYPSSDGLEVSGFLVLPPGFDPGTTHPLLVVVHGGPMGVFSSAFSPRRGAYPVHAFAEAGYVVFLPNPRGSGGFGEAMRKANVRDWGFGDLRDIMAGVDHLIERGFADPERLGLMGWSYGGFMTAWTITQTERFKAASIGAAITNPYSFYGVTDIPEFMEAYFGGPPFAAGTDYLRHAAEHHVEAVKTPSLIQHGEDDRRVPISQGYAFYRALSKAGVPVEMVTYPRTPHGLSEPRLIRDAMERNLAWFDRWIGVEDPNP